MPTLNIYSISQPDISRWTDAFLGTENKDFKTNVDTFLTKHEIKPQGKIRYMT